VTGGVTLACCSVLKAIPSFNHSHTYTHTHAHTHRHTHTHTHTHAPTYTHICTQRKLGLYSRPLRLERGKKRSLA